MISKEKIKNLFDKNIPIYGIDYGRCLQPDIVKIPVRNLRYCPSNDNYQYLSSKDGDCYLYEFFDEDLYETQEDAEEFIKYGNITKTFKFPFVSYNDFLRGKTIDVENIVSVGKMTKFDAIVICDEIKGKQQIIDYATRENYHKALDIAKNLFLGEDKNEN